MSTLIDIFTTKSQNMKKTMSSSASLNLLSNQNSPVQPSKPSSNNQNSACTPRTASTPKPSLGIRFLVFVENSNGSRSTIFDSDKFEQTEAKSVNKQASTSKYKAASCDNNPCDCLSCKLSEKTNNKSKMLYEEMLTRMVFGSSPMLVSNRTAIKIHSLK